MKFLLLCFFLAGFVTRCPAPGVDRSFEEKIAKIYNVEEQDPVKARDREYARYLLRVVQGLREDEAFKKRKIHLTKEDIPEGKLTNGLYAELSNVTRAKLDTLKLAEIEFQDQLKKADKNHMLEKTDGTEWNPIHQTDKKFSQNDLDLLLGRFQALVKIRDAERREKFNEHQMEKELKHREDLEKAKSDEDRKTLEEKEKRRHEKKHDPLHRPLSGPQLREIWSKYDGLDPESFDLKTLFKLHDKDGDEHLDKYELETLFLADLDKAYDEDDEEFDPAERDEDMERMREVAMEEVDTDRDGKVSYDELLAAKERKDFEADEGYKPLYEGTDEFSEEELEDYKQRRYNSTVEE